MSGPGQTCADCAFFQITNEHALATVVVLPPHAPAGGPEGDFIVSWGRAPIVKTEWPSVDPDDWCGEWEAEG